MNFSVSRKIREAEFIFDIEDGNDSVVVVKSKSIEHILTKVISHDEALNLFNDKTRRVLLIYEDFEMINF